MSTCPVQPFPEPAARVCIVDADALTRAAVGRLLGRLGADVRGYGSAWEFLASLPLAVPVCLIAATRLPDIGGLALLQELRGRGLWVPTILLSAEADISGAVTAMRAGAIDFIEKPHIDRALVNQVAPLLGLDAISR